MESIKILVIDDEKNILESIRMVLSYEGYPVETASSGLDGIELFKKIHPDIVILDVKMPGFDGLSVLENLKKISPETEIIMISGHSGIEEAMEASRLGVFDFLEKPVSREKLIITVRNASEKVNLLKENVTLRSISEKKHELVGESHLMDKLRKTIDKVARTNSTVLITGESGTGKELIARRVHRNSRRSKKSFVQVNCAAIPEELIESELFGHEKGSFTGAFEKKQGKFESAHLGSIFLDEIGDLSLKAQAKVLRVLEEGEIQRVGTAEIKKVDVRIIAATNQDLKKLIRENSFREDLYFRLNVVPVYSPPLRDRIQDIPLLVSHFVNFFTEENNYRRKQFSPEVIQAFQAYPWKGNVRELRNVIERLMIMSEGRIIRVSDLPPTMISEKQDVPSIFPQIKLWKDFKFQSEKYFIEKKLKEFNFNISRTSREIEIPRSNLYKKIESFNIALPDSETVSQGSVAEDSPDS